MLGAVGFGGSSVGRSVSEMFQHVGVVANPLILLRKPLNAKHPSSSCERRSGARGMSKSNMSSSSEGYLIALRLRAENQYICTTHSIQKP